MSVSVELLAKHSSGKDHLAMTGGTLSADKLVQGSSSLVLQHEFFPVAGVGEGGGAIGKRLIDMSPYMPGLAGAGPTDDLVIGFRSTFVSDEEPLARDVIATAYDKALRVIRDLFARGGAVPFSTPQECGQYNLHSAEAAVELIDGARGGRSEYGSVVEVGARELYVCDLRLVKPRLPEAFEQRVLDVLGGHYISQVVERTAWTHLDGAGAGTVTAGNFGCSTGEYLMVGNSGGLAREALLRDAHVAVGRVLVDLAEYEGDDAVRVAAASDARFALEHIERYGGAEVWGGVGVR